MNIGWDPTRIGDVLTIQNGFSFDSKSFSVSRGVPLIRIRDLKGGQETETKFDGSFDARYVVKSGDLLIGMDGEFGCYEWQGGKALLNQRVCRLEGFSGKLEPKFLFYGINKYLKEIEDVTTYTTVKHLSSKQIANIELPLPPLPEQQRIVAILDEAFAGLATATANAEKNLQNARELFNSYLQTALIQESVGLSRRRLEEVVDQRCSLSYGIVQPGDEKADGLPIVRPVDLTTKVVQIDGLKRIDPSLAKGYGRTSLAGGELLLCVRGTTGTVSIASEALSGANVTRGIVPITFESSQVSQRFGYYALCSEPVQSQIREKTYGAALMQINIRDVRNLVIPIPSQAEQERIATNLDGLSDETSRLQEIYLNKLVGLRALKEALLQKAFSGELTSPPSQAIKEAAE